MAHYVHCDNQGCNIQACLDHLPAAHNWVHIQEVKTHDDGGREAFDGMFCTISCAMEFLSQFQPQHKEMQHGQEEEG